MTAPYTLYTAPTPNGFKISIALEELGVKYNVVVVNLTAMEQKQPWFLALNPNGRIPVLVDHTNGNLAIFESGAILWYLGEKHGKILPADPNEKIIVMSWLMFQMSGVGPMQGQANVFFRYAKEKIPFAIERYQSETKRLYEVIDTHLRDKKSKFIVGDNISVADIALYPWIRVHGWAGVEINSFHYLKAWLVTMGSRDAVQRGMSIPKITGKKEDIIKATKSAGEVLAVGNEKKSKL